MNLEISEIQIIPVRPNNGLIAFASLVFNGQLYIGNVGVHTTLDGNYRLVFPSKVLPNGKELQCVFPINRQTGEIIRQAIVTDLENVLSKGGIKRGSEISIKE